MVRNLRRRVEVLAPVQRPELAAWVREVLLQSYLEDTERTWFMQPDGSYRRDRAPEQPVDVQLRFPTLPRPPA